MFESGSFKGLVSVYSYYGDKASVDKFENTTLAVGKKHLMAALGGNLMSNHFVAYINKMCWGTGGYDAISDGIRVVSPDTTGFVGGNVLEETPVSVKINSSTGNSILVTSQIGRNSIANGQKIDQIGLKLFSGDFFAITAWGGFEKTPISSHVIKWEIIYL